MADSTSGGQPNSSTNETVLPNTSNSTDQPDSVLLNLLMEMGMPKQLSEKALIVTKNKSIDAALAWIEDLGPEEVEEYCSGEESEGSGEEEDLYFKMVFVVNTSLKMGTGKIASQVAHAGVGLYRQLMEDKEKYSLSVEEWEDSGEKKITLRGRDANHLQEIAKLAKENDVAVCEIQDAGRTQIPSGSYTALALFGDEDAIDNITGCLKLL